MNPWEYAGRNILTTIIFIVGLGMFMGGLFAFSSVKHKPARVYLYILAALGAVSLLVVAGILIERILEPVRALRTS